MAEPAYSVKQAISNQYQYESSRILAASMGTRPPVRLMHPLEQKFLSAFHGRTSQLSPGLAIGSATVRPESRKWFSGKPGQVTVQFNQQIVIGVGRFVVGVVKTNKHLPNPQMYSFWGYYEDVWAGSGSNWHLQSTKLLSYQLTRNDHPIVFAAIGRLGKPLSQ